MHADAPHETCGLRLFAKHLKQTLIKHVVIGNIVANAGQVYIRCLSLGLKFCHCCVMNNLALDIDLIKICWEYILLSVLQYREVYFIQGR